jgi:hypothetical protein
MGFPTSYFPGTHDNDQSHSSSNKKLLQIPDSETVAISIDSFDAPVSMPS